MTLAQHSQREPEDRDPAKKHPQGERLVVSIAEAAALLGISRALAYDLAAQGELPVIRLGRRMVVPRRALLALVGEDGASATRGASAALAAPSTLVYRLVAEPGE
jgi:excisionase family DNA binding protein